MSKTETFIDDPLDKFAGSAAETIFKPLLEDTKPEIQVPLHGLKQCIKNKQQLQREKKQQIMTGIKSIVLAGIFESVFFANIASIRIGEDPTIHHILALSIFLYGLSYFGTAKTTQDRIDQTLTDATRYLRLLRVTPKNEQELANYMGFMEAVVQQEDLASRLAILDDQAAALFFIGPDALNKEGN